VAKPSGSPVSKLLHVPARGSHGHYQAIKRVLKVIDSLHGDGQFRPTQINVTKQTGYSGVIRVSSSGPIEIEVTEICSDPEFTAAHEIGHLLDVVGIDPDSLVFADQQNKDDLSGVFSAIMATDTYRGLREMGIEYYLDPAELWARAYSQWITLRSGDETLRKQLEATRAYDDDWLGCQTQWPEDEFEPIAETIDDLMQKLGWQK